MSAARVLLVEDEAHLAEVVGDNLALEGFDVERVADGRRALERARAEPPDLIVLDVMLPGIDGFEVCRTLRAEGCRVPILFLTARVGSDDRVRGLELGGDDYLGKPFELRELILRVHAILRRGSWERSPIERGHVQEIGRATLDLRAYTVTRDGRTETLGVKEALILRYLLERAGEAVSRAEILDRVWGYEAYPTTRTVDNFIVRLRRWIEPDPSDPQHIRTVRGIGYRLTMDDGPADGARTSP